MSARESVCRSDFLFVRRGDPRVAHHISIACWFLPVPTIAFPYSHAKTNATPAACDAFHFPPSTGDCQIGGTHNVSAPYSARPVVQIDDEPSPCSARPSFRKKPSLGLYCGYSFPVEAAIRTGLSVPMKCGNVLGDLARQRLPREAEQRRNLLRPIKERRFLRCVFSHHHRNMR